MGDVIPGTRLRTDGTLQGTRESSLCIMIGLIGIDNVTVRYSQVDFSIRCMFPKWGDWDIHYTGKGMIRQRVKQILQLLSFIAILMGALSIRQDPVAGLAAIPSVLTQMVQMALSTMLGMLDRGKSWLA